MAKIIVKVVSVFILLAFLSGCATTSNLVWYHPTKTLEEAQQDAYDCEYRAKSLAYTRANQYPYESSAGLGGAMASGVMSGAIQGSTMSSEYSRCMQAKGFYLRSREELNQSQYQSPQHQVKQVDSKEIEAFKEYMEKMINENPKVYGKVNVGIDKDAYPGSDYWLKDSNGKKYYFSTKAELDGLLVILAESKTKQ